MIKIVRSKHNGNNIQNVQSNNTTIFLSSNVKFGSFYRFIILYATRKEKVKSSVMLNELRFNIIEF